MHLTVHLDQWADQQTPERLEIVDSVTLENRISAAPTPDGHPPDRVRDEHGLAIPAPHHGDKKIGAHPFIFGAARVPAAVDIVPVYYGARRMEYSEGVPSSPNPAAMSEARPAGSGGATSRPAASAPNPFEAHVRVFGGGERFTGEPIAPDPLENRVVEAVPGLSIDRTGSGGLTGAGIAKMQNATVVDMDQGPAGLRQGGERASLGIFKNVRSR